MQRRIVSASLLLVVCVILIACGNPEAERNALGTAVAASIFATQTAGAPALASTPAPPTATPLPPTTTPMPCPTLAPISAAIEKLSPFQALMRDKVSFLAPPVGSRGNVVATNASDGLLGVFFEGFQKDTGASIQDIDWILRDEACKELKPIGFGVPLSNEPIVMLGTLRNGSIFPGADGASPLLVLVFVVPKQTTTVTLLGPRRQEHGLSVSTTWLPMSENFLSNLQSDGRIDWIPEGDNWKSVTGDEPAPSQPPTEAPPPTSTPTTTPAPPIHEEDASIAQAMEEAKKAFSSGLMVYLYDPQPKTVSTSRLDATEFSLRYIRSKDARPVANVVYVLRVNSEGATDYAVSPSGYIVDWTNETGVIRFIARNPMSDMLGQQAYDFNMAVFQAFIGMTPLYGGMHQKQVDNPVYVDVRLLAPEERDGALLLSASSGQLSNVVRIPVVSTAAPAPTSPPTLPTGTPVASPSSLARQPLKAGALPDNAARALDAAIQKEYYTPDSFTAKALRMMASMKKIASGYVEMGSSGPLLPFPPEGGEPAFKPLSPSRLQVRGRADGTDITILNYEEFVLEVERETELGGVTIPQGAILQRMKGSWVLAGSPPSDSQLASTPSEPTVIATATPGPPTPTLTSTPAATSTPTHIPTSTARLAAKPTATRTRVPTPVAAATRPQLAPVLVNPADGASASGRTTFTWQWSGPALVANQAFEVRIWREGQPDHYGAAEPTNSTHIEINLPGAYGVAQGGAGTYFWTVAVVQVKPYQRTGEEAPRRRLQVDLAGGAPQARPTPVAPDP
jgi:hypothetical protein